jgi:hypothetical protein
VPKDEENCVLIEQECDREVNKNIGEVTFIQPSLLRKSMERK